MWRKMKKMLSVHPKIPKHCVVLLLYLKIQPLWSQYTWKVKDLCRKNKNQEASLKQFFPLEIDPYIHNPPVIEWILIGIFFFCSSWLFQFYCGFAFVFIFMLFSFYCIMNSHFTCWKLELLYIYLECMGVYVDSDINRYISIT